MRPTRRQGRAPHHQVSGFASHHGDKRRKKSSRDGSTFFSSFLSPPPFLHRFVNPANLSFGEANVRGTSRIRPLCTWRTSDRCNVGRYHGSINRLCPSFRPPPYLFLTRQARGFFVHFFFFLVAKSVCSGQSWGFCFFFLLRKYLRAARCALLLPRRAPQNNRSTSWLCRGHGDDIHSGPMIGAPPPAPNERPDARTGDPTRGVERFRLSFVNPTFSASSLVWNIRNLIPAHLSTHLFCCLVSSS